tara:strand:+ start:249 stop:428 length:180 start_codon:yes stop_codon:yes gene_type:complete
MLDDEKELEFVYGSDYVNKVKTDNKYIQDLFESMKKHIEEHGDLDLEEEEVKEEESVEN